MVFRIRVLYNVLVGTVATMLHAQCIQPPSPPSPPKTCIPELLKEQQVAKVEFGQAVASGSLADYIFAVNQMTITGVGSDLINYLTSKYPIPGDPPKVIVGMNNLPFLPVISTYTLYVSPTVFNAPLAPGESILVKGQNLFKTIQSAIDFAVNFPTTPTTLSRWTILVDPGTYLENLSIGTELSPSFAVSITLAALGKVILGDGVSTGNVSWVPGPNSFIVPGRVQFPGIMFSVYRTADTNYNARWNITQNFTVDVTRLTNLFIEPLFILQYVTLQGILNAPTAPGIGNGFLFSFQECVFNQSVFVDPNSIYSFLISTQGSLFQGLVSVKSYAKILGCVFTGGMFINTGLDPGSPDIMPQGFYRSQLIESPSGPGYTSGGPTIFYYLDQFTQDASSFMTAPPITLMKATS